MPSLLRNKKDVWLVHQLENEVMVPILVATTFRSAYKLACFEAKIARPSMAERKTRIGMKKAGSRGAWIFDLDRFSSYEEARYSPIGSIVKIERVPLRKA
jgi:hypothetical protein